MEMNYNDEYGFCTPYLVGDEYILWKGKPEKGNLITSSDIMMIPFSLMWCGFAIYWELSVIASGGPFFFALFGLPFVCIGLYLVFGRFITTAYNRKRTAYVITNKKIIRQRCGRIDMLDGRNLPAPYVTIHKNGNGTIRFGEMNYRNRGYNTSNAGVQTVFMLENIADVTQAQQALAMMEK